MFPSGRRPIRWQSLAPRRRLECWQSLVPRRSLGVPLPTSGQRRFVRARTRSGVPVRNSVVIAPNSRPRLRCGQGPTRRRHYEIATRRCRRRNGRRNNGFPQGPGCSLGHASVHGWRRIPHAPTSTVEGKAYYGEAIPGAAAATDEGPKQGVGFGVDVEPALRL